MLLININLSYIINILNWSIMDKSTSCWLSKIAGSGPKLSSCHNSPAIDSGNLDRIGKSIMVVLHQMLKTCFKRV